MCFPFIINFIYFGRYRPNMQFGDILALAGLRGDGRQYEETRRLSYKLGGNLKADGSAYFEQVLMLQRHANQTLMNIFGIERV